MCGTTVGGLCKVVKQRTMLRNTDLAAVHHIGLDCHHVMLCIIKSLPGLKRGQKGRRMEESDEREIIGEWQKQRLAHH